MARNHKNSRMIRGRRPEGAQQPASFQIVAPMPSSGRLPDATRSAGGGSLSVLPQIPGFTAWVLLLDPFRSQSAPLTQCHSGHAGILKFLFRSRIKSLSR
jgi:hypothetical protein